MQQPAVTSTRFSDAQFSLLTKGNSAFYGRKELDDQERQTRIFRTNGHVLHYHRRPVSRRMDTDGGAQFLLGQTTRSLAVGLLVGNREPAAFHKKGNQQRTVPQGERALDQD